MQECDTGVQGVVVQRTVTELASRKLNTFGRSASSAPLKAETREILLVKQLATRSELSVGDQQALRGA